GPRRHTSRPAPRAVVGCAREHHRLQHPPHRRILRHRRGAGAHAGRAWRHRRPRRSPPRAPRTSPQQLSAPRAEVAALGGRPRRRRPGGSAARGKRKRVPDLTPAEIDRVMTLNFTSPMRMGLAVLPRMLARGSGLIVNVGSVGGRFGIPHEAAYCAAKFALSGWSEVMAIDLAGTGVNVKLVLPGPIATEIWET